MPRTRSTVVVASPALAAETQIALIVGIELPPNDPIDLQGWVDATIGTSGTTVTLRIRQGNGVAGTAVATGGPFTVTAANRYPLDINGSDLQAVELFNQSYSLTCQVANGAAQTTINAVCFWALW